MEITHTTNRGLYITYGGIHHYINQRGTLHQAASDALSGLKMRSACFWYDGIPIVFMRGDKPEAMKKRFRHWRPAYEQDPDGVMVMVRIFLNFCPDALRPVLQMEEQMRKIAGR